MCLKLNFFSIKHKATKDIVVYKGIIKSGKRERYLTPYRFEYVNIGETYTSNLRKKLDYFFKDYRCDLGLHSFKKMDSVSHDHIKVKCIIPKGSYYYKGKFLNNISYASNKLTYIKIIE